MNRIWVNKAGSFEAANRFEAKYYAALSSEVRVETVQLLREMHFIPLVILMFRKKRMAA
jgi:hypothetical protein